MTENTFNENNEIILYDVKVYGGYSESEKNNYEKNLYDIFVFGNCKDFDINSYPYDAMPET